MSDANISVKPAPPAGDGFGRRAHARGYRRPIAPPPVPTMRVRLAARVIDGALLSVTTPVLLFVVPSSQPRVRDDGGGGISIAWGASYLVLALVVVLCVAYEVSFIALRGATPGKQLLGIWVARRSDGTVPGWIPAAKRVILPLAGALAFWVGALVVYVSAIWDGDHLRRGWHDKFAGTIVVARAAR